MTEFFLETDRGRPAAEPPAGDGPSPGGAEPTGEKPLSRRQERVLELVATIILALATLGTAWSGYQATRWSGVQAASYVTASGLRVESTKASTAAGQNKLYDSQVFSQWVNAYDVGDTALAAVYERRFRAEFRPAFNAWIATDPLHNLSAPAGPTFMPEYVSADAQRADDLEKQAAAAYAVGVEANETADSYVLNTVFLASALFLAGVAGRFEWRSARIAVLATSAVALVIGLLNIVRLPVH
jgi:hypothetical protein